jgi:extradiol dioxygenase family protein
MLVKNLDELAQRLTESDVQIKWDDDLPDFRRLYVNDPFGNRLEFMQPSR